MQGRRVLTRHTTVDPAHFNGLQRLHFKWDFQGEEMPTINITSRGAVSSHINKDVYISQLIRRLEELNVSRGASPSAHSASASLAHEATTCCHPESPPVLRQPRRTQLKMLTHRLQSVGLQHPNSRHLHRHTPEHSRGESQDVTRSEPSLKITPLQVAHSVELRHKRWGDGERAKTSYCWDVNTLGGHGLGANGRCLTNISSGASVDFHSDDSDLSDQEKGSVQVSDWATPVDLYLRPELFDMDLDPESPTETAEAQQLYPEVLPVALKVLDPTQSLSSTEDWECRQSLQMLDSSLIGIVARLVELERLQTATVQKERAKPGRSRPATASAVTRSPSQLRKADLLGCQSEFTGNGEYSSVLPGFTDLALSHNTLAKRRENTCASTKLSRIRTGAWLHPTLARRPQCRSAKLRTEILVKGLATGESLLPKPTPINRAKRDRATKKATRPQREMPNSAKKSVRKA